MSTACVAALGVAVLAACASNLGGEASDKTAGGSGLVQGGPVAYTAALSEGGDDASLEGVVQVSDVCLVVVDRDDQRWLPIFQAPRTTWDGTTLTYDGNTYTDGSQIRLGGGGGAVDVADYAPEGCDHDLAFIVAAP